MKDRIIGFDLARAYAIFGMFIVNFNTVFGSHTNHEGLSGFLNLFNGNSSTLFVMLAGMGTSLMSNRNQYTPEEKSKLRRILIRRSWFLFFLGVAFYLWWPADILHFYGGYMHLAAFLVFLPKNYFLYAAAVAILLFHVLLAFIPYDTGWNFSTLQYTDFWTIQGFLRNTFFNGWNSIFPWISYFLLGMYLGRLSWQEEKTPRQVFLSGISVYLIVFLLQTVGPQFVSNKDLVFYLTADYLPPFIPFLLGTASFGCILISVFMWTGKYAGNSAVAKVLAATGQMTLTHYLSHLVLGLFLLSVVTGKTLDYDLMNQIPTSPRIVLTFAVGYFFLSCTFSHLWTKRWKNGPFETLMRKWSDG